MLQRLIPSILINDERLCKGIKFKNFKDAGSPASTARAHNHQGADELIVSDINASKKNNRPNFDILSKISKEVFMPLTFFGGISTISLARKCMDIGTDKIGLNTQAIENPKLIRDISRQFGSQAVVIGVDILKKNNSYYVFDHRNSSIFNNLNPFDWIKKAVRMGAGEIRVMSVANEGTLNGYDYELYFKVRSLVNVPIILEGGCGSLNDISKAFDFGIDGVALGSLLVFADNNLIKIKKHLITNNKNVRE